MPFPCDGAGPPHWEDSLGQAYRGSKRTILCIDDDSIVLQYERALLEKWGYHVLSTASAEEGLSLAMMLPIDGVILDFHMPGMNGHNVAAAIKKCRPDIRIVMFSGSEIPEETCDLVDAVVLKTDAIAQLVPTLTQLLQPGLDVRR